MKTRKLMFLLVFVMVLSLLPMPVSAAVPDGDLEVPLYAGQDKQVGTVKVTNNTDSIHVTYALDDGWVLTEVHLSVEAEIGDIPTNKKGNPIPGHFEYKDYFDFAEKITETSFDVPIEGSIVYIAAHAVVTDAPKMYENGRMFGTKAIYAEKGLYEIDVVTGEVELLKEITGTTEDVDNGTGYTNGLAYDPGSNKLYFTAPTSVRATESPLWAYDIDEETFEDLCVLEGSVVSGSFYEGAYYYIAEVENELRKIENPEENCNYVVVADGFGTPSAFTFGDIAIESSGMLYGSTRVAPQMFFSMDLTAADVAESYTEYGTADALDLQLAYGSDGILYGVNHASGKFTPVDVETGDKGIVIFTEKGFADLASGALFEPQYESAWAATEVGVNRFVDKGSWATYFTYELQEVLFDTVVVEAYSPVQDTPVSAYSSELTDGQDYKFVVSGTAFAGDTIDFDAKYSITNRIGSDEWTDAISGYSLPATVLDLYVDGVAQDWGSYTSTHVYEKIFTGDGTTFEFYINDVYCTNNSGSLTVDIYWMP